MKRKEAIRDLDIIRFNPHWDELVNEEYWQELMDMAITALQNQPVWIPVSERLPEKYGSYLVAWKPCNMIEEYVVKRSGAPHFYEILEYDPDDESGWIESIEQATGEYEILAWMPLPEPYRESEEENGEV